MKFETKQNVNVYVPNFFAVKSKLRSSLNQKLGVVSFLCHK